MASWLKRKFSRTPSPAKQPVFPPFARANVEPQRDYGPSDSVKQQNFSPSSRPRKPNVDHPVAPISPRRSIPDRSSTGSYDSARDDDGAYTRSTPVRDNNGARDDDGARTRSTPVDAAESPYAQYKAKYLRSGKDKSPPKLGDMQRGKAPQPSLRGSPTLPKPAGETRHRPVQTSTDESDSISLSVEARRTANSRSRLDEARDERQRFKPLLVTEDSFDTNEVKDKKEKKRKEKKRDEGTTPKMAGPSDPWASMGFPTTQTSQLQPPPAMEATIPPNMIGQGTPSGTGIELREDKLLDSLLKPDPYGQSSTMTPQFGFEPDVTRPMISPQNSAKADPELLQGQLRQQAVVMRDQMKHEMADCVANMEQVVRSQMQLQMQEQQRTQQQLQQQLQEQQRIQQQMQEQQEMHQQRMIQQMEQNREHCAAHVASHPAAHTAPVVRTAPRRTRAASFGSPTSSRDHALMHDTISMPSMPSKPYKTTRNLGDENKISPGTVTTFLPLSNPRNCVLNGYNDGGDDNSPQFSLDALVVPSAHQLRSMRSPFQDSSFGRPPKHRSDSRARVLAALKGYDAHDILREHSLKEHDSSDRAQRTPSPSQLSSAILRRIEDIEIKHQREREQMLAWKEQQEILNKKQELQVQQLMRAVRSLIHISEASLERADSPPRRTSTPGNLEKVQDHLVSVEYRLREARLMLHTNLPHDPLKPKLNEEKMEQILLDAQSAVEAAMVETHTPPMTGDRHRPSPQPPVDTKPTLPATVPAHSYSDATAAPLEALRTTPPIATLAPSTIQSPTPVMVSPNVAPASPSNASLAPVLDHTTAQPSPPENGSTPAVQPSRPPPSTQDWSINEKEWNRYADAFTRHGSGASFVEASYLMALVTKSRVDRQTLLNILTLCDLDKDGKFTEIEFVLAMHMVTKVRAGFLVPSSLPTELKDVYDKKNAGTA